MSLFFILYLLLTIYKLNSEFQMHMEELYAVHCVNLNIHVLILTKLYICLFNIEQTKEERFSSAL
jgi:hypothetical protein